MFDFEEARRERALLKAEEAKLAQVSKVIGRQATWEDVSAFERKREREEEEASLKARAEEERIKAHADSARRAKFEARRNSRNERRDTQHKGSVVDKLLAHSEANNSNLQNITIEGNVDNPIFIEGDFEYFNFDGAIIRWVRFSEKSKFEGATFIGANFEDVIFLEQSEFQNVDFRLAKFKKTIFHPKCNISSASFEDTRFDADVKIEFDHNKLTGAAFGGPRRDRWYKVSNSYTTLAQFLNTLLPISYFTIILGKLHLFRAISRLQGSSMDMGVQHRSTAIKTHEVSVFEFIFSGDQWLSAALAGAILIYQGLRFYLTNQIAPLMDAERQSGFTPEIRYFEPYESLNAVAKTLGYVAIGAFCYELFGLFTEEPITVPLGLVRSFFAVGGQVA